MSSSPSASASASPSPSPSASPSASPSPDFEMLEVTLTGRGPHVAITGRPAGLNVGFTGKAPTVEISAVQ